MDGAPSRNTPMTSSTATRDFSLHNSQPATELVRGDNYVLAIAIDKYAHMPPLHNCTKDVSDLIGILTLNYVFEDRHVVKLFAEDATTEKIIKALDGLAQQVGENDSLLVMFSGHGHLRNGIGFWVPVDAQSFASYLPVSTVRDYLEPIKARHILVIADACFSGRFFVPTRGAADSSASTEKYPSRYALTAGRDEPVQDGKAGENSPFAEALKYRLNKVDDAIGAIMLSELVAQDVVQRTEGFQTPRHGELNIKGNDHGQFFFHKKRAHAPVGDPFVEIYFKKGGDLFPPGDRSSIQEHFDEYDRRFDALPEQKKAHVRRLNTEHYLHKWGLTVAVLKEKLSALSFYKGAVDDEYTEDLAEALADFQRHHMMRQIDGYFGELTYEKMVTALLMSGLARFPERR